MSINRINPMPMGTPQAAGQVTPAMSMQLAQAYGRQGGRASAAKRSKAKRSKRVNGTKKRRTKLKFGSPAWRAKFMRKGKKRK